jgi:ABC-type antimicrobial peptide transport system permease subunit
MERLSLFIRHAYLHLIREKQRTLFVLFCIAAGVAAVVSLRTLGLMMQEALTGNLQAGNKGDLNISMPIAINADDTVLLPSGREVKNDRSLFDIQGDTSQSITLSRTGQVHLQNWAAAHGFEVQFAWNNLGPFTPARKVGGSQDNSFIMIFGVDAARYPFYESITLLDPPGVPLEQALAGPRSVVVTDNLAEELKLHLGDQITLTGASGTFSVSGIISPKSEASFSNLISGAVFPFVYLPYETAMDAFRQKPNNAYLRAPSGVDLTAAQVDFLEDFPGLQVQTPDDLRRTNEVFSNVLTRLVTVMGLASLLIGGIGIANTMLVIVSRRTLEIAVLKTVGVQSGQIVLMFVVEALMLGVAGSTAGVVLGQGLAYLLRNVGERFVSSTLPYAVYPEALLTGWVLGIIVTLVFGFLPILDASRVRPNVVLAPQNVEQPGSGRLASLAVLSLLTAIIGLIVGQIVGDWMLGLGLAYVTLLVLGLSTLGLSLAVWLVSRLPSFGSISLKLAQRALGAQRDRAASTLLALTIGLFALGTIWLLVQGTLRLVQGSAEELLGGNILVVVQSVADGRTLERKIARMEGVTYAHDEVYSAEIIAINGDQGAEQLAAQAKQRAHDANIIGADAEIDHFIQKFTIKMLEADILPYRLAQGRDITDKDEGEILLEVSLMSEAYEWFDLKPGDTLTLRFPSGARRTARIAGITAPRNAGVIMAGLVSFREFNSIAAPRLIPMAEKPIPSAYLITAPDGRLNETMDLLASTPGVYMVATEQLNAYTERFAGQFVPLPLIAVGLALFASAVIMANTVSLATLERRRQIGIMKALGLQSESVLGLLLLENGIVGLAGGLLGAGLSVLTLLATQALGDVSAEHTPYATLALLVLLAVVLSLAATLITAWGAAHEKPLNVLRYE